jgi:hydrogenase maturation factor
MIGKKVFEIAKIKLKELHEIEKSEEEMRHQIQEFLIEHVFHSNLLQFN